MLLKQYGAILNQKFTRDPGELLRHLERVGTADPATLPANERFIPALPHGDWAKIREELAQMPPDLARQDLRQDARRSHREAEAQHAARRRARPRRRRARRIHRGQLRKLGQLLGLAVPANESYWLADRLQKGTDKLGGTDPAKRLLAGRVLLAGGFKDLARTYLPPLEQVEQIADEGVRNELTAFLATQRESEAAQRGQVQKIWDENLRIAHAAARSTNGRRPRPARRWPRSSRKSRRPRSRRSSARW